LDYIVSNILKSATLDISIKVEYRATGTLLVDRWKWYDGDEWWLILTCL